VAGTVLALGGEVGSVLAVGTELVRLEVADAGSDEVAATPRQAAAPEPMPAPKKPAPAAAPKEAPTVVPGAPVVRSEAVSPSLPRPAIARPIASPAVRRRARDAGVDLRQVRGSGPAGRIRHDDLDAFLHGSGGVSAGAARVANANVETVKVIG